jgi:hypothetical protein
MCTTGAQDANSPCSQIDKQEGSEKVFSRERDLHPYSMKK